MLIRYFRQILIVVRETVGKIEYTVSFSKKISSDNNEGV